MLNRQKNIFLCRTLTLAAICVTALAVFANAVTPVLSRLDMVGGTQGIILTVEADAPFGLSIHEKKTNVSGESVFSILCTDVIYGLNEFEFSNFPQHCPIKMLTAKENKNGNSVELVLRVLNSFDKSFRVKQKGNRWIVLVTSDAAVDFVWHAQNEGENPAPKPIEKALVTKNSVSTEQPRGSASAAGSVFLDDICVFHRDRVEKVTLQLSSPSDIIVKCTPGKILVLFVNAKNGLSHTSFKTEKDWLVKSIDINEATHGGTKWLAASILVNVRNGSPPVIQTLVDRVVIYSVRETKQCLYSWSAKTGTLFSYDFIGPRQYPVDYTKMEQKVETDSKNDIANSGTFSVGKPLQNDKILQSKNEPEHTVVDARNVNHSDKPVALRLAVIKDKVNLRSAPSTGEQSSVIAKLNLGDLGTFVEKQDGWVKIACGAQMGWVASFTVQDSAKVPQTVWNSVAKKLAYESALAKKKALAEELAAKALKAKEEKIAAEKAKQEQRIQAALKVKEEKLAVEKAKQEQRAQAALKAKEEKLAQEKAKQEQRALVALNVQEAKLTKEKNRADTLEASEKTMPEVIEYHVFGRDPLIPLSQDEEGPLPSIEHLQLVGILYDAMDRIGLFEDIRNKSRAFALRENDRVKNGYVQRIQSDKVLFLINELGISRTYAVKLYKGKEK